MIVKEVWDQLSGRPNMITTSYSEYYIEQGVKIERLNNGKVVILDTTSFGDDFKSISKYQQDVFNNYGFRAGQLVVLISGLGKKLEYLEKISADNETIKELSENIFNFKVEFEKIMHNFAVPKSETGIFSQKNNL
jgi:hypothetical protein